MGFYRQEHWGGWPFPYPRDVPNPGIKPESPTSPALADDFFYLCGTFSLKIPQFCSSGRHCFGKDPQCSPCLLQVINLFLFSIFGWLCLLTRHPQRSEPSFHVDVNPSPWIWLLPVTGREVVAGQRAMEERKQNTWEEEPRNQHLQSTYTVILMHTKMLELLGCRASEEH